MEAVKVSEINSIAITDKALKFRQLAGKWSGSKDEVEVIKRAITV